MFDLRLTEGAREEQNGNGNREIEVGAVFGEFGGGEADGDFAVREGETRVGKGGANTLASLGDGLIGHTNKIEGGETAVHVAFDGDQTTFVAAGNGRIYFCNHVFNIQYFARKLQRISMLNGKKVPWQVFWYF